MTINSETRVAGPFEGNDSTVAFPFTFKVFDSDEVLVVRATDAIETVLTLGDDYSVTLNPDQNASPGGTVTLLLGALATGSTLTLTSDLEFLQPLDLTNQGGFYPRVINNAFDRVTILLQQLATIVGRTLKFPLSDGPVGDLPGRSARAGTVLAFNVATGEPEAGPDIADVNTVATNIAAIGTVATNIADVNTVATNIADVNTVATNIADVNTVADNLADLSNFSGVYYGPSATDPTTRRDGSPLQAGDLYFNTFLNALRQYNGAAWVGSINGAVTVQNLSGDGVETEFLLNYAPESEVITQVYISGVYQQKNTYALGGVGGATLIFDEAPPAGTDNIEIVVSSLTPSDDVLRTDLANDTDPALGAGLVARTTVAIASVLDLLAAKQEASQHLWVRGYHAGSDVGGGMFYWDATRAKSLHNGGTIISPTVPWTGSFATLAAFLVGTGETDGAGFGCWVRIYEHDLHVAWFGSVSNDATKDNKDVMEAAKQAVIAKSAPNMPGYILPDGALYYSASPNFGEVNGFRVIGAGADGCRLKYTGPGHALNFDPSDYDIQFRYGYYLEGFLVDAGPSATAGLYLENIAHSTFKQVYAINGGASCILFDVRLGVLLHFDTCGTPINRFAPSSVHQESLRLAASPSKLQNTTACIFTNFIAEGASGAGIRLIDADCNVFNGGTSEANTGRGVLTGTTCRANQFNGLAMEANTVGDVNDAGQMTRWSGGYATSGGEAVTISASARSVSVCDMMTNTIIIGSGARGVTLKNVGYNHGGSGTYTDNGTDTVVENLRDRTSGLVVYPKKARAGITVTASPFTYTNATGRHQNVVIQGGTVTQILYKRAGDTVISGQTSGMMLVAPGDELVISYSSAPNMSRVPLGNLAV